MLGRIQLPIWLPPGDRRGLPVFLLFHILQWLGLYLER